MATKFYHTFISTYTDASYRIEFGDNTYVGDATLIEMEGEVFKLRFEEQGHEIYNPIKTSQCDFFLTISDDSAGTALQSWLTGSVLNGDEDRYTATIYEASVLIWHGVILPDIAGRQDASRPYQWQITASDGINRLKNFEFNPGFMAGGVSFCGFT